MKDKYVLESCKIMVATYIPNSTKKFHIDIID